MDNTINEYPETECANCECLPNCHRRLILDHIEKLTTQIFIYQMPEKLGGDWAASSAGFISDGFKSRSEAEEWALTKAYPIKDKQGNRYRNIGAYIDLDT